MHVPAAPLAGFQIEFKVAVARSNFDHMFKRGGAQRSSSQIRMQNDARRIDDAPQRVALILVDLFRNGEMESGKAVVQAGQRVLSPGYLLLNAKQHGARGTNHRGARFGLNDDIETGIEQEIIKRGQQAVQAA